MTALSWVTFVALPVFHLRTSIVAIAILYGYTLNGLLNINLMLSLTNACRKGKQLLFILPFLTQHAWSIDGAPLIPSGRGDSICLIGDPNEQRNINEALAILSCTNPDLYKDITEARDVFVIRLGDFSAPNKDSLDFRRTTVFFNWSYIQIEQQGSFGVSLSEHNALRAVYSPDLGFVFSRGGRNSGEGERVEIPEEEADSLIKLKDPVVVVQAGLCRKKLARVLAHEFGHVDYILKHKARAEFYPADPALLAHDKGNPDGETADAAERQFDKEYKKTVRSLSHSTTDNSTREGTTAVR
jgi:hypothetical protein